MAPELRPKSFGGFEKRTPGSKAAVKNGMVSFEIENRAHPY